MSLPSYDRVRITADGPYRGLCGKVELVYYDRHHTGSSPDQLNILLDDGRRVVAMSDCVECLPAEGGTSWSHPKSTPSSSTWPGGSR